VGRCDEAADTGLAEAVADLYGVPPGDFTATRDRRAREARQAGDADLAQSLQGLRRPTVAAWAVNLLVREEAELLAQVVEIGEALRQAQAGLEGQALRELSRQRRELVTAVVARARALVTQHGGSLSTAGEQQVAATLNAALADPAAADAVLAGSLVRPLEATGLENVELADHVATSGQVRSRVERGRPRLETARARVAGAEQTLSEARRASEDVREQHEKAQAHLLHLEARIDELRRGLTALESEAETACEQVEALELQVGDADAELEGALAELEASKHALRRLE
jgi:hypothetical protein